MWLVEGDLFLGFGVTLVGRLLADVRKTSYYAKIHWKIFADRIANVKEICVLITNQGKRGNNSLGNSRRE